MHVQNDCRNKCIKHISCECKCKFDGTKRNSNECLNKYKC